ncbi:N-acylneuraminate-9-phosphatase isoform X2 [Latimeria chalumnae]|uniref:N-acylneuraminate-9-phosphatase isoform X2 n=1 Tax=Latimeria chalumnae TaxID=7897 RepID=UPI0006D91DF3|nr:PREDICTED: N-acylneuraminate-9-phosphatase isoform X2 [Latimeria chalumnae]|eukprot:XP_014349404.1 PREDICTED: N-acylneuraminate-9-phosphatase isoform X2 [Latimeria chalumnae]
MVKSFLRSQHQYTDAEVNAISDCFQAQLLREPLAFVQMKIDELRASHWEKAIQETKGLPINPSLATECYFLWKDSRLQHLVLAEDVKAMLTELRKTVKLLLLTNGEKKTQREKIEVCGCLPYFDAIVIGGEHKEEKPAPSIFYHCCELLRVSPEACVMVGDTLGTDIQGGINAKLKATVWVNPDNKPLQEASAIPHFTISSVLDTTNILKKLCQEGECDLKN